MSDPFERPARPWDLFNKNLGRVQTEVAEQRLSICKACEHLLPTGNCSKCGCFMSAKVKLPNASCPIGLWDVERVSFRS